MRVLFTSTGGYGHIFPMVPLARAMQSAGHAVLWATGAEGCQVVAAAGIEATSAGLSGPDLQRAAGPVHAHAATLPGPERPAYVFPRLFGEALSPAMAQALLPIARSWQPDLLVNEQGELAAPLVAALLGVPSVTHSFGGAVPEPLLAEASMRLAPMWAEHDRLIPPFAGSFTHGYLDLCPAEVCPVPIAHIPVVQPLRPVSYTGAEGGLPALLDDDPRPLVYLTLGTVQNKAPVLQAAVEALAGLPVRLLVTVGPNGDPAALGPQPAHVAVERWVPQRLVLPRCAVLVSHAGSGTFLGALAVGLPQLCLPQAADQFRNAAAGVRSGAALALSPDEATAEAIRAAVQRLLAEEGFREKAGQLAEAVQAMPSPEEVVPLLERLVTA